VAWGFLSSLEGATDAVQGVYQQTLRRAADAQGLALFPPLVQAGAPLEVVADTLFSSPEYYNLPH
jgi:hypothetical protein